jgi:GTP cyclohydrolase I
MAQTGESPLTEPNLQAAARHFKEAFHCLGVALQADTPHRIAKAWAEMLDGYHGDWRSHAKVFALDGGDADEPTLIPYGDGDGEQLVEVTAGFVSVCEHHVLPFEGSVTIQYRIQAGWVLGASKVVRIIRAFARRLQIQERLTRDIARAIAEVTGSPYVRVETVATHACMRCRGVADRDSHMRCIVVWDRTQQHNATADQ